MPVSVIASSTSFSLDWLIVHILEGPSLGWCFDETAVDNSKDSRSIRRACVSGVTTGENLCEGPKVGRREGFIEYVER
jgi:hypothetical protein